jgi:hypothetical protein
MIDAMFVAALQENFSNNDIETLDEMTLLVDGTPFIPFRWVNEIGMYLQLTPGLQEQVLNDSISDIIVFMNR